MMPGNNQASDKAATEAVEDRLAGTEPANATNHEVVSERKIGPQGSPFENDSVKDDSSLPGSQDGPAVASAEPAGDSLDFGDQRMGGDGSSNLSEVEQLQKQVDEAETKAADNWDRLVRLQAEIENQRKRAQNDVAKARKFALEGIVGDLLPVKDSLEMGLAAAQSEDADSKSIVEGADLTLKMLAQVLEKNNIIEINPVGEKFDPEFHQAMSMKEVDGVAANTVASVMQKGYTLNDRLVRPALVMVAK